MDRAFAAVFALPAAERKAATHGLEDKLISYFCGDIPDFNEIIGDVRQNGTAAAKKHIKEEWRATDQDDIGSAQIITQIVFNVSKLKGNEASPLMKAFIAAAAKLTDKEYNSEECMIKPMCATIDAVAKSKEVLKPNPLRTKPAPKP